MNKTHGVLYLTCTSKCLLPPPSRQPFSALFASQIHSHRYHNQKTTCYTMLFSLIESPVLLLIPQGAFCLQIRYSLAPIPSHKDHTLSTHGQPVALALQFCMIWIIKGPRLSLNRERKLSKVAIHTIRQRRKRVGAGPKKGQEDKSRGPRKKDE